MSETSGPADACFDLTGHLIKCSTDRRSVDGAVRARRTHGLGVHSFAQKHRHVCRLVEHAAKSGPHDGLRKVH